MYKLDGFKAYKYYMAIKLHFTSPKYNVFVTRGHVKGTYDAFAGRNDRMLFEKLARQYPNDRECIQYIASNFMYGNSNVVYHTDESLANYKEYLRRKQSLTHIFTNDLHTIIDSGAHYEFSGLKIPDVLQLLMAKRITLETVVILNSIDHFVDSLKQGAVALLLGDELMKIEKSKGFVKVDSAKTLKLYQQFLEDIKGNENGQDIPTPTIAR